MHPITIDHGLLLGLGDDDHTQYWADTTIGTRAADYTTTGTMTAGIVKVDAMTIDGGTITNLGGTVFENTTAGSLTLRNTAQDEDIILSIDDGGVTKTLTLDASDFSWLSSTNEIRFQDDLIPSGTVNIGIDVGGKIFNNVVADHLFGITDALIGSTLALATGSITDSSGQISFGNEKLVFGNLASILTGTTHERFTVDGSTNPIDTLGSTQQGYSFSNKYDGTLAGLSIAVGYQFANEQSATFTTGVLGTAISRCINLNNLWSGNVTTDSKGGANIENLGIELASTCTAVLTSNFATGTFTFDETGGGFTADFRGTLTETLGALVLNNIGGRFRALSSTAPTLNGTPEVNYIGGDSIAEVPVAFVSLASAIGHRFTAFGGDTNIGAQIITITDANLLNIGLDIGDISGATTNLSIYSRGGDSIHVGSFKIGADSAPAVPLDVTGETLITLGASDDIGLDMDGTTTDFTTQSDMKGMNVIRDFDWGTSTSWNAWGSFNQITHSSSGAVMPDAGTDWINYEGRILNTGTLKKDAFASAQRIRLIPFLGIINDDGTYDTTAANLMRVRHYGAFVDINLDQTYTDTGGNDPGIDEEIQGVRVRINNNPTTGAGTPTVNTDIDGHFIDIIANADSLVKAINISRLSGADTLWAYYNNTAVNNLMSNAGGISYFRDTGIGIYSQADTFLDLFADGSVRIGNSSGGAPTTYLNIENDGDTFWVGAGTGLVYGHMNVPAIDITVDTSATVNPVEVKDDGTTSANDGWASSYQNEVTFAVSDLHYQTVTIAGTYEVVWDMSIRTAAGGGTVIHGGITVDSTTFQRDNGEGHTHVFNANDDIQMSGVGVVDCPNGNEEISLWVSNSANQKTIVEHGNMRIKQIGGT